MTYSELLADALVADRLTDDQLGTIVSAIEDHFSSSESPGDIARLVEFWRRIAGRLPEQALARLYYADALIVAGRLTEAIEHYLVAIELRSDLVAVLDDSCRDILLSAPEPGPRRFHLADLHYRMYEAPDEVDELYCELLDVYHDDPKALDEIHALGRQLHDRRAAEKLPQVFLRRPVRANTQH